MAFPQTVLPLTVELYLGGAWTDITGYVERRSSLVQITRGRSDEGSTVDRGSLSLTLDNRDGRFSPRLPTGPYYGQLGRNTPIRVAVESGAVALYVEATDDTASTPDSANLSITGDLDVRAEADPGNWLGEIVLARKYVATGDQRSWVFGLTAGYPYLTWSTAGTEASELGAVATARVPVPGGGRMAVRATLDVNNGASGHTVTFYTSDAIGGSWTQLGDAVTESGTTSIFDSTAAVEVGGDPAGSRVYKAQVLQGIAGTVRASPDFTAQSEGATSFQDAQSNTWTVGGTASITARRWRFTGEVSEWPPKWDPTGSDVYTPIEAAGILQRLGQGDALQSAAYRGALAADSLVAYWPAEDEDGSTSIAPALDHPAMTIIGTPEFGGFEEFAGSKSLPTLNGSEWRGSVPKYTAGTQTQVRWLMHVPSGGAETGETLLLVYGTGTVRRWEVYYTTASSGSLGVRALDAGGASLHDSGAVAFGVNGLDVMLSLELTQDGADSDYALNMMEPGELSGVGTTGTVTSQTIGRIGTVVVSPGGGVADVAIGHVTVQSTITDLFDRSSELAGHQGETAGRRIQRLCDEEGLPHRYVGDLDDTVMMGAQRPETLLTLLRECADADGGMLYEPRSALGVGYRTRASLYVQEAAVELDYASGELSPPLEPTDDDRSIRNDVTVTREGGSSARAVQEAGPLSVLSPPDGVGRYPQSATRNLAYDLQLFDHASWLLHLGTVDETRYPTITVDLSRTAITGDAALTADIVRADVGDLLTIDNPPDWLPPETIRQIVQGVAEVLGNYEWGLTYNCAPASPYDLAVYSESRYGPSSTVTSEALDTTETGVDITTPTGPLWDTSASGYRIIVGGEVMTVSAVGSATGTAQTLTVVRSVNGVVKSHASGASVELAEQTYYAL